MGFLDQAKGFLKKVDTDDLAAKIQQNSHNVSNMATKSGFVNANTAHKLEGGLNAAAKQIDNFGDQHPEMVGKKAQQAPNPHAPVGQQGAQHDPSAPYPPNANMEKPPPGQPSDQHAGPSYNPGQGAPPQFNSGAQP